MAFLPWFRIIMFILITIFSLVTLGMGAYIEKNRYILDWNYTPIIFVSSCLTSVTLPLFLGLGAWPERVFTSTILFESIWFFILTLLWAATAILSLIGYTYCGYNSVIFTNEIDGVTIDQVCFIAYVGSIIAFVPGGLVFLYDMVIFWYAVINASLGRSVWSVSVKEAATNTFNTVNSGVSSVPAAQFVAVPVVQNQNYATASAPSIQPYYSVPQQVPPSSPLVQPFNAYPQPGTPYVFFAQPHNAYSPQILPQNLPPQQYIVFPSPQGPGPIPQAQNQASASPGSPQQLPQPSNSSPPVGDSQTDAPQQNQAYVSPGSPQQLPRPSNSSPSVGDSQTYAPQNQV